MSHPNITPHPFLINALPKLWNLDSALLCLYNLFIRNEGIDVYHNLCGECSLLFPNCCCSFLYCESMFSYGWFPRRILFHGAIRLTMCTLLFFSFLHFFSKSRHKMCRAVHQPYYNTSLPFSFCWNTIKDKMKYFFTFYIFKIPPLPSPPTKYMSFFTRS